MDDKTEKKQEENKPEPARNPLDILNPVLDAYEAVKQATGVGLHPLVDATIKLGKKVLETDKDSGSNKLENKVCDVAGALVSGVVEARLTVGAYALGAAAVPNPIPEPVGQAATRIIAGALAMGASRPIVKKAAEETEKETKKVCHATFDFFREKIANLEEAKKKQKQAAIAHNAEANARYDNSNLHGQRLAYQQVMKSTRYFDLPYTSRPGSFMSPQSLVWKAESQVCFEFLLRYGRVPSISERLSISSSLYSKANSLCTANNFSPGLAEFSLSLCATNLVSSYNSYNTGFGVYSQFGDSGLIGGVASEVALISDLVNSETQVSAKAYYLCLPTKQLPSESLIQRIQQEVAKAYFTDKTLPFFSLSFNQQGFLYPIIHPAFQNTLVGEVIGILDYWLKGFLNGGVFDEKFLKSWHETANMDENNLRLKMIDLKAYCKAKVPELGYLSLRELESQMGINIDQAWGGVYQQPFMTSFRIIAYQEKIECFENIWIPYPKYKVEYSIDIMPDYKQHVESYQKEHGRPPPEYEAIHRCYTSFAEKIQEQMSQLPFCQEFFNVLGLINAFCYFYATLEKMGQKPVINTNLPTSYYPFPKSMPPIPVRYFQTYDWPLTLADILEPLRATPAEANVLDASLVTLFTQKSVPADLSQKLETVIQMIIRQKLQALQITTELNEADIARILKEAQELLMGYATVQSEQIHSKLNANFKQVPLNLSADATLQFIKLPIIDKVKRLESLFQTHHQNLKRRWEQKPELALKEIFDQFPRSEHDEIRKLIPKFKQEFQDLLEYDMFTQTELDKFVKACGEFVTEDLTTFQQNLSQEKQTAMADFEAKCAEERAEIEKIRSHLNTQIQTDVAAIARQEKHTQDQLTAAAGRATQANIDKFLGEQNALIAELKKDADQFRSKLAEFEKLAAPHLVNAKIEERRQTVLARFTAKEQLKAEYDNYKQDRAAGRQTLTTKVSEAGQKNLSLYIKDKLLSIMDAVFSDYSKNHAAYLERLEHFASKILEIPEVAKTEVSKNYTHSFLGFTGEALNAQIKNKWVGGCGMSVPNLESKPIPHAQEFCETLASSFKDPEQQKAVFQYNGTDYSAYCLPVYSEDALLFEDKPLPTESTELTVREAAAVLPPEEFSQVLMKTPISSDDQGYHPMHYAARTGNKEAMALLLVKERNLVDIRSHRGLTPLMIAIQFGQEDTMAYLHQMGADFNHSLPNGLFPLYMAIQKNFTPLALWMLTNVNKLDVNKELDSKMTSLHLAIQQEEFLLAKKLIEKGAKADIPRKADGLTAFHSAAQASDSELLHMMLAKTPVDLPLESKKTALHLAAEKGQLANLELLAANHANLNASDVDGNTALHLAIIAGKLETALWLATKVDVNKQNKKQQTPSLLATQLGMDQVADILLKRGENPNLSDKTGHSYVSSLVQKGDYRRVKRLAERGVSMEGLFEGNSLLALAAQHGHFLIVYFLQERNIPYQTKGTLSLLDCAVRADEVGFLRENPPRQENLKPLTLHAIAYEAEHCLLVLLSQQTALMRQNPAYLSEAISVGNEHLLSLILKSWQNINLPLDEEGNTALHLAAKQGAHHLFALFSESGANFSLKNHKQQTVFDLALQWKDAKLLRRLLKASTPQDWPPSIWENKHLDADILKVLEKCKPRLPQTKQAIPHSFSAEKALGAREHKEDIHVVPNLALQEFPKLSSSDELIYWEFKTALTDADFEKARELLETHGILMAIMRSDKGGALFQLIFEKTKDLSLIPNQLSKELKLSLPMEAPSNSSLALLKAKGFNPSFYSGEYSVLLPILRAKDDKTACFRFELLAKHFPESIPMLLKEKIAGESFIKRANLAGFNHLVDLVDARTVARSEPGSFYALHEAVMADDYESTKRRLTRHSVNAVNEEGQTPLMLAAANGNLALVQWLLSSGAALNKKDFKGNHVLHYALEKPSEAVALALLPLIKKPNGANALGQTPLMKAAAQNALSVINYLCNAAQDVFVVDSDGRNALHYAAIKGSAESIRCLIKADFAVDEPENPAKVKKNARSLGRTPLHLAAVNGHEDAVLCLLGEGANAEREDKRGFALVEYAIISKNRELLQLVKLTPAFHNRSRDASMLRAAVLVEHVDFIAELIVDDVDLNVTSASGLSALHYACIHDSGKSAKKLLEGRDLILDGYDSRGFAPIHYAALNGHLRLILLLGLAKANKNQLSLQGDTALHLAVMHAKEGAVAALLHLGSDMSLTNKDGLTAGQLALLKGHWRLVSFFKKAGDSSIEQQAFCAFKTSERGLFTTKFNEFTQNHSIDIKGMMRHRFHQLPKVEISSSQRPTTTNAL